MSDETPEDHAPIGDVLAAPPPDPRAPRAAAGQRLRYGAALMSSLLPGLGHFLVRRHRRGLFFLGPVALATVLLIAFLVLNGPAVAIAYLADPEVVGVLLVLQLLILVWRLLAV